MIKQLTSNTSYYCLWGYMFRSLCDHHQAFLRIKSINAGYMLESQLCLQLVPVYYIYMYQFCPQDILYQLMVKSLQSLLSQCVGLITTHLTCSLRNFCALYVALHCKLVASIFFLMLEPEAKFMLKKLTFIIQTNM